MTYEELLRRPEWQQRRQEYIYGLKNRDNWPGVEVCEECFERSGPFHLHHRRYVKGRLPWEYEDSDMLLLCEICHSHLHEVAKFATNFIIAATPHVADEFEMLLIALMDSKQPKSALARAKNAILECNDEFNSRASFHR